MQKIFSLALMVLSTSLFAQEVRLPDFKNWELTDVSKLGYKKEALFTQMNRDLLKLSNSICSNRALVWAFDLKRNQNIDAGKIFMFFTEKTGDVGLKTWWYHVSPIINEMGTVYALDAGFPGMINVPLTVKQWLKQFAHRETCKEIKATEVDLVMRMFKGAVYPQRTQYGFYDCYYVLTPGGYWTPSSVAKGLLGTDETGAQVNYERDEIDKEEVLEACIEAATSPLGRVLGGGKKRCEKYLGL